MMFRNLATGQGMAFRQPATSGAISEMLVDAGVFQSGLIKGPLATFASPSGCAELTVALAGTDAV